MSMYRKWQMKEDDLRKMSTSRKMEGRPRKLQTKPIGNWNARVGDNGKENILNYDDLAQRVENFNYLNFYSIS